MYATPRRRPGSSRRKPRAARDAPSLPPSRARRRHLPDRPPPPFAAARAPSLSFRAAEAYDAVSALATVVCFWLLPVAYLGLRAACTVETPLAGVTDMGRLLLTVTSEW